MGQQTITSVNFGMGDSGRERLRLYQELAKKRGYASLSAFIVDLVDAELGVNLPKPKGSRPLKPEP